jgi:fructose-specific phosphotransferase system IIC component
MTKTHTPLLVAIGIGVAGGITRYLDDVANHGRRFAFISFIAGVSSSAFFSWLTAEFVYVSGHEAWAFAAAGVGGFLGSQTMAVGLAVLYKRLGITKRTEQSK